MTDKTLGAYQRHDADDFAQAEFARGPGGHIAARGAATTDFPWLCGDGHYSDDGMADAGWSPVRECPDPDEHILARDYAAMSDRATSWQERAEKAEKESARLATILDTTARQRDDAEQRAVESRPLTPDAISDAAMRRAVQAWEETGELRPAIFAALTEPPARPEGAEELNELIGEYLDSTPGVDDKGMADFLAERGVRVVGEGGAA